MSELLTMLEEILNRRPSGLPAAPRPARGMAAIWRRWLARISWRRSRRTPAVDIGAGKKLAEQLTSSMLNQPEYPALRALALLARHSAEAQAMLTAQHQRLATSPHLPLRALAIETAATRAGQDPHAVMRTVISALDTGELAADTGTDPLPAHSCVLLASDQLRSLLLHLCWPHYDLVVPLLGRMLRTPEARSAPGMTAADLAVPSAQAAHNAAMIAATAMCRHPEAATLTHRLARQDAHRRHGITIALTQILPFTELTGDQTALLTRLFDDPDDDVARLAATSLRNIPASSDDLAQVLMSAAAKARTFKVAPDQIIHAVDHYRGNIPGTVLDITDRFFQLQASQDSNPRGFHDGWVLSRLVISIYDSTYKPGTLASPLTVRALDLIDAMVLSRTYELEQRLAQLDR
jgi:hypothetical protein